MFGDPPKPTHIFGTSRGEALVRRRGREAGRDEHGARGYRTARDSTSLNPAAREPIDPRMPEMPPA